MHVDVEPEVTMSDERRQAAAKVESRVDTQSVGRRVDRVRAAGARVEQLLTVAEAAQFVGCCEETIRRAYLSRQLQVLRFGARRVRIRPSALVGWLERGGKTTAA
jgi:excisionase family DNA binding protein